MLRPFKVACHVYELREVIPMLYTDVFFQKSVIILWRVKVPDESGCFVLQDSPNGGIEFEWSCLSVKHRPQISTDRLYRSVYWYPKIV